MNHSRSLRGTCGAVAALALAGLLVGCPPSPPPPPGPPLVPPTVSGAAVNGILTQGQASTIEVTATAFDTDGQVETVTADLERIGGSQAQPLELGDNNLWRWVGVVAPPNSGTQRISVTATDNDQQSGSFSVNVTVFPGQTGPVPPELSNLIVSGSLSVGLSSAITVSVTAIDPDGVVQTVTADLTQVGGLIDQPLTQVSNNLWTFSGTVFPTVSGTRTVTVSAVDDQGATSSATTAIVVSSPVTP